LKKTEHQNTRLQMVSDAITFRFFSFFLQEISGTGSPPDFRVEVAMCSQPWLGGRKKGLLIIHNQRPQLIILFISK